MITIDGSSPITLMSIISADRIALLEVRVFFRASLPIMIIDVN